MVLGIDRANNNVAPMVLAVLVFKKLAKIFQF